MDSKEQPKFSKFPRTKHLLDASPTKSNISRDDLIMDNKEMRGFLTYTITVEEKVDGANIGISMNSNYRLMVQNRSHFVTSTTHKQFSTLDSWLEKHSSELVDILSNNYILFGEWLYAKHSVYYTNLPGPFLAFDIFDVASNEFLSRIRLQEVLQNTSIPLVPIIAERKFKSPKEIITLLETTSSFYNGPVEGVYLRINDDVQLGSTREVSKGISLKRSKVVRPDFIQQIEEQWTKQKFVKNIVTDYT